ncbi:hypothetical protein SIN8267_00742 [Sinobacterium norvegicum]|uniref:Flagellar protein FliT n=1 Tax=Sinobacterium norvegicum TaxID=1641715 RepID=A0ABN8EDW6_9GAMM|nr:Wadjet anti-phage system protein JetA family protein [Sinobacterium norvegicum]CAH0990648.1 hypothetical protein SIN8267_00742 [Sinobacterium norvegicum]
MFFDQQRLDFFRPLTSKYREVVVECVKLLYQRLYGSLADYGQVINRELLVDVFQEAAARAPLLDTGDDQGGRFKTAREQANWVVNQLLDCGWLQKQLDEATMQSSYAFTREGRQFTQPFVDSDSERLRTHHRNTRNTRNTLKAFSDAGDIHDLLDALQYSERIISDFTDIIAELDDRKRQLVRDVEAQSMLDSAAGEFFDFMESRFQPDIAVRLSADNVEKYREEIAGLIESIKQRDNSFKAAAEKRLRQLLPPDTTDENTSWLFYLLETISGRLDRACAVMLPALRQALQSFTRRADIIIRQLSYMNQQSGNDCAALCQELGALDQHYQYKIFNGLSDKFAPLDCAMVDPADVKLRQVAQRQALHTEVSDSVEASVDDMRELYITQMLDQAFAVDNKDIRRYVVDALSSGNRVDLSELPVTEDARSLLNAMRAIEVAGVNDLSSDFQFSIGYQDDDDQAQDFNALQGYIGRQGRFYLELINKG